MKLLSKLTKILSALGVIALLGSQVFSAPGKTSADSPRFNFLEGDRELFSGLNYTKSETVYTDPVESTGSDQLVGLVYYHNGVVNTIANNTIIQVGIDNNTSSTIKKSTASISADNAPTVTDTVINGQVVGKSGLTVNAPTANAQLEFVPGSVRWFPEGSATPVALPNGQTGDTLVTSGVNIGDIQGCWQYSGYLQFGMRVTTPIPPADLAIEKVVRNQTLGETSYQKENTARPGDILDYQVTVKNTGGSDANPVILKDTLPANVALLDQTIKLFANGSISESTFPNNDPENIFNSGASLGLISKDSNSKITFSVRVNQSGINNGTILINNTSANYQSISVTDSAKTVVNVQVAAFSRSKSAWNLTKNVNAESIAADQNDLIKYRLATKNIGNGAGTVTVTDGIADILEYAEVTDLGGGKLVENNSAANDDDRMQITYPEANLAAGESNVVEFTVKVKSPLPTAPKSGYHYDLKMYNFYGNQVVITITPPPVLSANLSLIKNVRDVTTNEISFNDENKVYAGDIVEYQLIITNSGNGPADSVKITDILPANLSYIAGTTVLVNGGVSRTLADGVASTGVTLPQIPAGETYIIYLRAKIDSGVATNSCFLNTANVSSTGFNLNDTAKSCVLVEATVASVTSTPTSLPVTGPGGILASLFGAIFVFSNLYYFKGKKEILKTALSIQN